MKRTEFIEYLLSTFPIKRNEEKDYKEIVLNYYMQYENVLKSSHEDKFSLRGKDTKCIINLMSNIGEVIELIYTGYKDQAYSKFKAIMDFDVIDNVGLFALLRDRILLGSNYRFYRIRKIDNPESAAKWTNENLFHAPYTERAKISPQRFSTAESPCLYLGKSSYICWEELGQPQSWAISKFHVQWPIAYIDLSVPSFDELNTINTNLWRFVFNYPLIIACLIPTRGENCDRPEYVIPQFLTEYIQEKNTELIENNQSYNQITAIMYTSTHLNYDLKLINNKAKNLAIPALGPFENKYSEPLCNIFYASAPLLINEEWFEKNSIYHKDKYTLPTFNKIEESMRFYSTTRVAPQE